MAILMAAILLTQVAADEDKLLFESLKIGRNVVHNVRVVDSTPTHVTLFFDGGGTRMKREDLPPELKALYPYDAKAAAEYEKQQEADKEKRAEQERVRQEQFNRQLKASLQAQRPVVQQRIQELQKELHQLEKEMVPMRGKAAGKKNSAARAELDAARDRRQALIHSLGEQQQLLATIDQQLARLP